MTAALLPSGAGPGAAKTLQATTKPPLESVATEGPYSAPRVKVLTRNSAPTGPPAASKRCA